MLPTLFGLHVISEIRLYCEEGCKQSMPFAFKWYVNYTQTIEKVMARKNDKVQKHLSKWQLKPVGEVGQLSSSGGPGFSRS